MITRPPSIHAAPADVAILGGGPAGLMAAERLAAAGHSVSLYDRMPSLGRKFLLAGRGGLNLTHSEPLEPFLARYRIASEWLAGPIAEFSPDHVRAWAEGLGQETFIGSSGRVFPRTMKASPLLRAWLRRLDSLGVRVHLRHEWRGWTPEGALVFHAPSGEVHHRPAATLLALGGASWPRLGADGGWVSLLARRDVEIRPLEAANSGVLCPWSDLLRDRFAGAPVKSIALEIAGERAAGEMILTREGLEGSAIYALSAPIRAALAERGNALLTCDLRPDSSLAALTARLGTTRKGDTVANRLRKAGLSAVAIALVQEQAASARQPLGAMTPDALAQLIKALPLRITGLAGLDRAISTAGGVRREAVTPDFMLSALPGVFVAGEMLDWDAPTGGYLLQACFATGVAAADGMLRYLAR